MTSGAKAQGRWALVIHGGAGGIRRGSLRPEQDAAYREALDRVIRAGAAQLDTGGSALDAVETAVRALEDDVLFNAGRGAVFDAEGRNALDASIMDGRTLAAGAVAGVRSTRNPVSLARAVMEHSPHVMLSGDGADAFARERGLASGDPAYFFSERRWRSLVAELTVLGLPIPERPPGAPAAPTATEALAYDEGHLGTVGAVALDREGCLAAATSTGGRTAKRWGRVGDSPIIGAGCYASNRACAISCTGEGEYFIRLGAARAVAARVELQGQSLAGALEAVIGTELAALGGEGGAIAVTPDGQVAWRFNADGMHRACAAAGEAVVVSLYGDEP